MLSVVCEKIVSWNRVQIIIQIKASNDNNAIQLSQITQLNYGYKSREYLTGRPHLTNLGKREKYKQQRKYQQRSVERRQDSESNDDDDRADDGGENDDEKFVCQRGHSANVLCDSADSDDRRIPWIDVWLDGALTRRQLLPMLNVLQRRPTAPVSYTHLTLPTNREV